MHLFVCNLNAYDCFEPHTEPENVVIKISVIFSVQSWQVCITSEMPNHMMIILLVLNKNVRQIGMVEMTKPKNELSLI